MPFNGLPPEAALAAQSMFDPSGAQDALYGKPGSPKVPTPTGAYADPRAAKELFAADIAATELTNSAAAQAAHDLAEGKAEAITATGDRLEANSYLKASQVSDSNGRISRASTGIQQYQQDIAAEKGLGGQQADIAGAGFGGGASAMYLARSSASQAALAHGLIGLQGEITAGGFEQQSLASQAQMYAASTAADKADVLGGAATEAAGVATANAAKTAADLRTNALNSATALTGVSGRAPGITQASPTYRQPVSSGGGGVVVVHRGATGDAADQALGGTLNLDPTGGGLL